MFTRALALLKNPLAVRALQVFLCVLVSVEVYLSLISVDLDQVDLPNVDKLMHTAMHATNVIIAACAFPLAASYRAALLVLFLLGPSIELLQDLTPHRTASWADQFANTLGFVLGLAFAHLALRPRLRVLMSEPSIEHQC